MTDLVELLREFEGSDSLGDGDFHVCYEAADEIERLRAWVAELEAVLTDEVREHCAMRDAALEVGNVTLAGWHWARANVLNKATRTAPMKEPSRE